MREVYELPMLPLSQVFFPYQHLALNIFEDRYLRMLADLGDDHLFGTCLIAQGSEVGGGDRRTNVGVSVRILDRHVVAETCTLLFAVGVSRLFVREWLPDDPYPRALVTFDQEGELPDPAALTAATGAVRAIRRLTSEINVDDSAHSTCRFDDDPRVTAWQCCSFAPMGSGDAQQVLLCDDVNERLRLVSEICHERCGDLQRQLAD